MAKGAKLDNVYLNRLKELGYHNIYVLDELTEDIEPPEIIGSALRMQASSMVYELHNQKELLRKDNKISGLRTLVKDMILEIFRLSKETTIDFPEIKTFDNYLYSHSVNVSVLGILIGWDLGLNDRKLEDFGVGALLHDIGKIEIPQEILNKDGPLTEDEFTTMKKHTLIGFEMQQKSRYIKPLSYTIALQHHESYDGTGYPRGRKKEEIHIFSRMAEVVDIFDALTSDRPYKPSWSFIRTLNYLRECSAKKIDPEIFEVFAKRVPQYPLGSTVELSTGELGIVFQNDPGNFEKPHIRIFRDAKGREIPKAAVYEINLAEHQGVNIVSSYEDKNLAKDEMLQK